MLKKWLRHNTKSNNIINIITRKYCSIFSRASSRPICTHRRNGSSGSDGGTNRTEPPSPQNPRSWAPPGGRTRRIPRWTPRTSSRWPGRTRGGRRMRRGRTSTRFRGTRRSCRTTGRREAGWAAPANLAGTSWPFSRFFQTPPTVRRPGCFPPSLSEAPRADWRRNASSSHASCCPMRCGRSRWERGNRSLWLADQTWSCAGEGCPVAFPTLLCEIIFTYIQLSYFFLIKVIIDIIYLARLVFIQNSSIFILQILFFFN